MYVYSPQSRLDIEKTPNTNERQADRQIDKHYTENVNLTTYA